mgnify:CR=1 FL=1
MNLPPHPRLLFSREGIEHLKTRIENCDWAREHWRSVRQRADQAEKEHAVVPQRGGNWSHWYACPTHGCPLKTGKRISDWRWEHICPVGGETLASDPTDPSKDYDGCVISHVHSDWASRLRTLGLAYQITGQRRYALRGRDILLAYSAMYPSYALHNTRGESRLGGGRVGSQTLDEAVWLIQVCQGADLIWDVLSGADRSSIAKRVLLPAAREVILPHKLSIHNIQCWKNSAVGLVGLLLGDQELYDEAVNNPDRGYWTQLRKGVMAEGGWWEGAWGYHFYTMSALWPLAEAARNCGMDLYGPEFRAMFDAPLKFAAPNLKLPAFSDSGEFDLATSASIYELGYARYGDPAYLALITDRHASDFGFWFGSCELPSAPRREHKSANYAAAGFAILAEGKDDQATWLCLRYGPHGGGHGHPDKLSFVLCARGEMIGVDPGTARYGLPIQQDWYRTTIAHNTLTIDQISQSPAEGKCLAFGSERGVGFVTAEAGEIYEGVRFVRTAALLDQDLIVFVDQVRCETQRQLDLAYHQRGTWRDLPTGQDWQPPDVAGYKRLRTGSTRPSHEVSALSIQVRDGWHTALSFSVDNGTDIITATGVGANVEDRVPVAIFRRQAKEAVFVWALSLNGEGAALKRLVVKDSSGAEIDGSVAAAVEVRAGGGKTWSLVANPDARKVTVALTDGSAWQTASVFSVR